jgi:hypothetical protein
VLRALAQAIRQAAWQHEWLADLIGGRPQLGPNTLATENAVLAAMGVDLDTVVPALAALDAYVVGAVRQEITERRAERASGMDIKQQFQAVYGPYLERTFATGRFPALATVVGDGPHLSADENFRIGPEFLLDGIEARISS